MVAVEEEGRAPLVVDPTEFMTKLKYALVYPLSVVFPLRDCVHCSGGLHRFKSLHVISCN